MKIVLSLKTETTDGRAVELETEIVWINSQGEPPGVYTHVHWTNKFGFRFRERPRYYGQYGQRPPGLVVHEGFDTIVLGIPEAVYNGHINHCLEIFRAHSDFNPLFKSCNKPKCDVCTEVVCP